MQGTEKKMVALFKDFFEKTCLSVVKEHMNILKEWLYFSSMLSQQFIDLPRIQRYIQNLPPVQTNPSMLDTTKNFTLPSFSQSDPLGVTFKKKKNQIKDNKLNFIPSYSSAVTIGEPIFNLRSYNNNQVARTVGQVMGSSDQKFKIADADVTKTMISKLNCLYMTFVDNQHKLQFPKKQPQYRRFSDMHQMMYK